MTNATHVYIGSIPGCGCTVAGAVDVSAESSVARQHTAEWVADMILTGLTVERIPVEDARNRLRSCPHRRALNPDRPGLKVFRGQAVVDMVVLAETAEEAERLVACYAETELSDCGRRAIARHVHEVTAITEVDEAWLESIPWGSDTVVDEEAAERTVAEWLAELHGVEPARDTQTVEMFPEG